MEKSPVTLSDSASEIDLDTIPSYKSQSFNSQWDELLWAEAKKVGSDISSLEISSEQPSEQFCKKHLQDLNRFYLGLEDHITSINRNYFLGIYNRLRNLFVRGGYDLSWFFTFDEILESVQYSHTGGASDDLLDGLQWSSTSELTIFTGANPHLESNLKNDPENILKSSWYPVFSVPNMWKFWYIPAGFTSWEGVIRGDHGIITNWDFVTGQSKLLYRSLPAAKVHAKLKSQWMALLPNKDFAQTFIDSYIDGEGSAAKATERLFSDLWISFKENDGYIVGIKNAPGLFRTDEEKWIAVDDQLYLLLSKDGYWINIKADTRDLSRVVVDLNELVGRCAIPILANIPQSYGDNT